MSIKVSFSLLGVGILLAACGPNESQDTPSKEPVNLQAPITEDNWESHPSILKVNSIVQEVESALNEGSLTVLKTYEKPYGSEAWLWERHLDEDKTVLIVERWNGSIRGNDGSWEGRNYYNQDGKLVFTDFSFQSEYVDRGNWDWSATLYFDPTDESLFWITYKQRIPPKVPGKYFSPSWREKELTTSEYRWDLLPFPFDLVNTYRCSAAEGSMPTEDEYVIKSNAVDLVKCNEDLPSAHSENPDTTSSGADDEGSRASTPHGWWVDEKLVDGHCFAALDGRNEGKKDYANAIGIPEDSVDDYLLNPGKYIGEQVTKLSPIQLEVYQLGAGELLDDCLGSQSKWINPSDSVAAGVVQHKKTLIVEGRDPWE